MRNLFVLTGLMLAFTVPAHADFTHQWDMPGDFDPSADGLQGLHLNRASMDPFSHGISWDVDHTFAWVTGLDVTLDYSYPGVSPTPPDLVLAYSSMLHADNLRLRADDARMILGPVIGHPVWPYQFTILAGTQQAPLGGLFIAAFGDQNSLTVFNEDPTLKRTSVNFTDLWMWGTDLQKNGGGDLFLYNERANHPTITVSPDDVIGLAGTLQHQGSQAGFFGAPPVPRPVVTGSWSDGTAQKSLLAALVQLGLVTDQTTR